MTNMDCDQLVDYLNGSLNEEQQKQFEAHMAQCPECRDIVDATSELPYLAEPVAPDAAMKGRILDAVYAEEPQEKPAEKTHQADPVPASIPKRRSSTSKWLPFVAAALLVSLLGNAYAFYELSDREESPEAPAVAFETVELQPSESFEGSATAAIVREAGALNLLVQADRLAPVSGDEVYQVWLLKDGEPVPTGAFTPGQANEGAVFYSLDDDTQWDTIAITLEPERGNSLPEGEIVLSAAF